jgi:hypothetical protein
MKMNHKINDQPLYTHAKIIENLNLGLKLFISGVIFKKVQVTDRDLVYVGSFQGNEIISLPVEGIIQLINKVGIEKCYF